MYWFHPGVSSNPAEVKEFSSLSTKLPDTQTVYHLLFVVIWAIGDKEKTVIHFRGICTVSMTSVSGSRAYCPMSRFLLTSIVRMTKFVRFQQHSEWRLRKLNFQSHENVSYLKWLYFTHELRAWVMNKNLLETTQKIGCERVNHIQTVHSTWCEQFMVFDVSMSK